MNELWMSYEWYNILKIVRQDTAKTNGADNLRVWSPNRLSALRLSVWLFDNIHIHFSYIDQHFLFAFRTIQRKVFKYSIFPYFQPRLITT